MEDSCRCFEAPHLRYSTLNQRIHLARVVLCSAPRICLCHCPTKPYMLMIGKRNGIPQKLRRTWDFFRVHVRRIRLSDYIFVPRSLKLLLTTLTELKAMAKAASIGLSWRRKSGAQAAVARMPIAIGISATL
jgi:hypothetical protein